MPEPAIYHGVLGDFGFAALSLCWPVAVVELVTKACSTRLVVALPVELIVTVAGVNEKLDVTEAVVVAVKVTVPVKPLTGATVKTIPGAEPPETADALAVHGVKRKSGAVPETTSVEMDPLELALTVSPE